MTHEHECICEWQQAKPGWVCFYCDERFEHPAEAKQHFGVDGDNTQPGCLIKVSHGGERALLQEIRKLEYELARWRAEDTDLHRAIRRIESDHQTALRRAEEEGYAKGLRDARKECAQS